MGLEAMDWVMGWGFDCQFFPGFGQKYAMGLEYESTANLGPKLEGLLNRRNTIKAFDQSPVKVSTPYRGLNIKSIKVSNSQLGSVARECTSAG